MAETDTGGAPEQTDPDTPAAVLTRRRRFTIEVPGLGAVTYSRGEAVPRKHYEHVDGQDRRWFDAIETVGDTESGGDTEEESSTTDTETDTAGE